MSKVAVVVAVVIAALAGDARAEVSEAEQLFLDGLRLHLDGKHDEACAKFELSFAKDPRAVGTLMNLARCHERRGKIGTALRLLREAYDRAGEAGLTGMRDSAQERIAALTSQVPVVTLARTRPPLDGEQVVVDGAIVPAGSPAQPTQLPLDPGRHVLVQTAPGRLPVQLAIDVALRDRTTIQLAELQPPTVVAPASTRRTIGVAATLGGGGLALAGLGLALYAKRRYDAQFVDPDGAGPLPPHCGSYFNAGGTAWCDETGHARTERARTLGTIATVVGGVAAVATVTGAILWATSPRRARRVERLGIVPTTSGVLVLGRF